MTNFDDLKLKVSLILAFSIFMSSLNFMLSCVEHKKGFITLGPSFFNTEPKQFITLNSFVFLTKIAMDLNLPFQT